MTAQNDLDRTLAAWFDTEAVAPPPPEPLAVALAATRKVRPRAAVVAGIGGAWVGGSSAASVRGGRAAIPTIVWVALVVILVALLGASLLTGGRPALPAVVQASAAPSPSPTASPSPSPVAVLPGEPWIVYAAPGGNVIGGGIFLVRTDGTERHEFLKRADAHREHPDWSPDGSKLAFEDWYRDAALPGRDRVDIWISDADGANARQVTTCESPCLQRSYPAWSPDGTQLALARFDLLPDGTWGPGAIEILDIASGDISVVSQTKDGTAAYYTPRWSPDGSQIVFTIETYEDTAQAKTLSSSLAVARSDGTDGADPRILATPGLLVKNPDWHPVDDRIAFEARSSSSGSSTTNIYVIRAGGTGLVNLTNLGSGDVNAGEPTWTPDGKRIAFSQVVGSVPILGVTTAFMAADGSNPTPFSSDPATSPRLRPTP